MVREISEPNFGIEYGSDLSTIVMSGDGLFQTSSIQYADVTVNPGNYVRYGISQLPISGGSGQLFRGKNDYLYVVDNKGRSLQAFDNSAQGYSLSLVTKPSEDISLGTNTNTFAGAYLPLQNHKVINEPDPAQVDFTRELSHKTYELVDHLGNVTVTLTDERSVPTLGGAQSWAKVLSYTNYYAFGMAMPGRTSTAGYRYGFNGKENDGETSTQDYGFRIYNPALGRFLSVDPLSPKYPELTPYQFASNTPIQAIDLDGLEAFFVIHSPWYKNEIRKALVVKDFDRVKYLAIKSLQDPAKNSWELKAYNGNRKSGTANGTMAAEMPNEIHFVFNETKADGQTEPQTIYIMKYDEVIKIAQDNKIELPVGLNLTGSSDNDQGKEGIDHNTKAPVIYSVDPGHVFGEAIERLQNFFESEESTPWGYIWSNFL